MARKRFTIDKDGNAVYAGTPKTGDPAKDAAWDKLLEAEENLLLDYANKLITADELQKELKELIQQYRKLLGITTDQIKSREEKFDSRIESAAKRNNRDGLTSESQKRAELIRQKAEEQKIKRQRKLKARKRTERVPDAAKLLGVKQKSVTKRASKIRGYGQKAKQVEKVASRASQFVGSGTKAGKALGSVGKAAGVAGKALSAAAGPAAIAYEVADKIADSIVGVANRANKIMETAGKVVKDIAGNNVLGVFNTWSDSFQETMKEIGPAGKVVAAAFSVATTAVNVFSSAVNAFNMRARELMGYGGATTTNVAMADVNKLLADIREGQKLDKEYAEIVKAQGNISVNLQDALIPIKRILMQMISGPLSFVETASGALSLLTSYVDEGLKKLDGARDGIMAMHPAIKMLHGIKSAVDKAIEEKKKDDDKKAMDLFNAFISMDPTVNYKGGDAVAPARGTGIVLGIPRFAGP